MLAALGTAKHVITQMHMNVTTYRMMMEQGGMMSFKMHFGIATTIEGILPNLIVPILIGPRAKH